MLAKLVKFPLLKRLIPSLSIRFLKLLKKNRGYFNINKTKMFLDFLDPIDREIILHQEFEKLEINFLIKQININKIDYFLDVGANCGYYSLNVAKEVSNIIIRSFEPNNEAYFKFSKSLEKNLNLSKKIKLEKFGLSNKSKKLEMQSKVKFGYVQTGGSGIINDNKIKDNSIFFGNFKIGDEYIKLINRKIAIKIDVEGHELNVLEGLKQTLKKNKCILQIEIFNDNFEKTNNFLVNNNFKKISEIKSNINSIYKNYFYSNVGN